MRCTQCMSLDARCSPSPMLLLLGALPPGCKMGSYAHLGSHVVEGARASEGQLLVCPDGQAKVAQLELQRRRQEDVFRLDVPAHPAAQDRMCCRVYTLQPEPLVSAAVTEGVVNMTLRVQAVSAGQLCCRQVSGNAARGSRPCASRESSSHDMIWHGEGVCMCTCGQWSPCAYAPEWTAAAQ